MKLTDTVEKFYYLFPQTVAIVGVDRNLMPAAWHTPISAKPPLYGALISPKRHTYNLLEKEGGFTVNFLMLEQAQLIARLGSTSGRDIDKPNHFKIPTTRAKKVNGLIMSSGYATYECEKHDMHEYGDHYLLVGHIVLIHIAEEVLKGKEMVDEKKVRPALYFGKDRYLTIDPDTLSIFKRD
jgi:flavin reductase (DIM6/NTAB) family NADH-FMN oxidoreductase RutF